MTKPKQLKAALLLQFPQKMLLSESQDVWKSDSGPLLVGKEALMEVIRRRCCSVPIIRQQRPSVANPSKNSFRSTNKIVLATWCIYFLVDHTRLTTWHLPAQKMKPSVVKSSREYTICTIAVRVVLVVHFHTCGGGVWLGVYSLTPGHSKTLLSH